MRPEQNGGILTRALLISGFVIGMTIIVGIHPVTGSTNDATVLAEGRNAGEADCKAGKPYNSNQGPYNGDPVWMPIWTTGYEDGWKSAGCTK